MSITFLRSSVAALALTGLLGGAALAQTAPGAPATAAPEAPAATAPAATPLTAETLPAPLKALNLTDLDLDSKRRGATKVEGKMADGTEIEAMVDAAGTLRMVETDDGKPLPQSLVETLLPQPVRDAAVVKDMASITGIGVMPEGVMVRGTDAAGEKIRAGFAADGTLMRFGRGDDMRGPGKKGGGKDGWHHGRHGKDGGGKDRGRMGGMMGMGGQAPAALDDAAASAALTAAGYSQIGAISRNGPMTQVQAVNAAGEPVTVELNPAGQVVRESAR